MYKEKLFHLYNSLLKILYDRLTITRGQLALAAEIYVNEKYSGLPRKSPGEAGLYALSELGLEGDFSVKENVYSFEVKSDCSFCPYDETCVVPFYVASMIRKLSENEASVIGCDGEKILCKKDGLCVFKVKVYPLKNQK